MRHAEISEMRTRLEPSPRQSHTNRRSNSTFFTFMWPCIVTNFLVIKPTRCTNFSNLFCNETLHVSDSSSVPHQELFTVHSAMVYVIQTAFEQQDQDGTLFHPNPARQLSTNLYDIYHCCLVAASYSDVQSDCCGGLPRALCEVKRFQGAVKYSN
jgi:hypothetical protein